MDIEDSHDASSIYDTYDRRSKPQIAYIRAALYPSSRTATVNVRAGKRWEWFFDDIYIIVKDISWNFVTQPTSSTYVENPDFHESEYKVSGFFGRYKRIAAYHSQLSSNQCQRNKMFRRSC